MGWGGGQTNANTGRGNGGVGRAPSRPSAAAPRPPPQPPARPPPRPPPPPPSAQLGTQGWDRLRVSAGVGGVARSAAPPGAAAARPLLLRLARVHHHQGRRLRSPLLLLLLLLVLSGVDGLGCASASRHTQQTQRLSGAARPSSGRPHGAWRTARLRVLRVQLPLRGGGRERREGGREAGRQTKDNAAPGLAPPGGARQRGQAGEDLRLLGQLGVLRAHAGGALSERARATWGALSRPAGRAAPACRRSSAPRRPRAVRRGAPTRPFTRARKSRLVFGEPARFAKPDRAPSKTGRAPQP